MSTFGSTADGTASNTGANDYTAVARFQLTEAGSVSKLSAQLSNGASACNVKGCIYSDKAGPNPNVLQGQTSAVPISSGASKAYVDLTFSTPIDLSAGYYHLGFVGDNGATALSFWYTSGGGAFTYWADEYDDGPIATFVSADGSTGDTACINATYTTAPAGFVGLTVTRPLNG